MFSRNQQTDSGYRPDGYNHNGDYHSNQAQAGGYAAYQQSSQYGSNTSITVSDYLGKTFRWMALGLLVTFGMALATAYTGLFNIVYALYLPLTIGELAMVFVLSARIQKMQVMTARLLFLGYSALNGMVMSFYFIAFELSTLFMAFLAAGVYFGLLAVYGAVTKRDLTAWGPKLMMGLVALLVCSFIGMFTGFSYMTNLLYCGVGLIIFMLLTAYDTQKLYHYYNHYAHSSEMIEKTAIYGALSLYLDFINIFIFLLRMFGSRRD